MFRFIVVKDGVLYDAETNFFGGGGRSTRHKISFMLFNLHSFVIITFLPDINKVLYLQIYFVQQSHNRQTDGSLVIQKFPLTFTNLKCLYTLPTRGQPLCRTLSQLHPEEIQVPYFFKIDLMTILPSQYTFTN